MSTANRFTLLADPDVAPRQPNRQVSVFVGHLRSVSDWGWVLSEIAEYEREFSSLELTLMQRQPRYPGARLFYGTLTMATHEEAVAVIAKIGSVTHEQGEPRIYAEWARKQ
jgi:hypothetical protein